MKSSKINDYADMPYLWKLENFYLAGHPSDEALKDLAKKGLKTIFNLRSAGEFDYTDFIAQAKNYGIKYYQLPIMGPSGLDANICSELNKLVNDDDLIMVHCASANRVAGWLITYLVLNKKMDIEDAIEIAMENGLTNPGFIAQAQNVIDELRS